MFRAPVVRGWAHVRGVLIWGCCAIACVWGGGAVLVGVCKVLWLG